MIPMRAGSNRANAPERHLIAYSDGGARGNPGPAGYGVVIQDERGRKVAALSKYLGHQTNNVAEYQGLIAALEYAVENGHTALKVVSDSELLVRQVKGIYKVKNSALRELHGLAKGLIAQLEWFSIEHVLRGHNQQADDLANAAMDEGMGRSSLIEGAVAGATAVARTNLPGKAQSGAFSSRSSASSPSSASSSSSASSGREFNGIVRGGKIELTDGELPEGTSVQVRPKK